MSDFSTQRKRTRSIATTTALRTRNRTRALTIESLEERVVLTTITWNNRVIGDGLFTTASNWLGGVAPGANDDAVINLAPGTVTFSTGGSVSVHSLSTNATTTFVVAGGTLNINSASTLGPVVVSGGTLGGSGALTLTNTLSWTAGTLDGPANTEVMGAITLGSSSGTTASSLTLSGGRSLTIDTSATGSPNGAALSLNVRGGSTITNQPGATLTFTSNTSVVSTGSPPPGTIVNQGTLSTNGGTGTTSIGIPIINTGTIQAQTGTLIIGAGSTFSSTTQLNASAGATLNFAPASYAIPAGATSTGAGGLLVNGATITYAGAYGLTGLTQIDSGGLDFNAAATLGSLLQNGGTRGGSGAVVVNGQTTWTGGTITGSGSTQAKGGLALGFATGNNPSTLFLASGHSLINDAAATGAANGALLTLTMTGGSSITNKAGGTFTFTSNTTIPNAGGSLGGGTFINLGTLGTNGGTGTTTVGIPITNTGTIRAQTGTLVIGASSTFSSTTQLAASAGATLNFVPGTYTIPAGATATGNGGLLVNGATITYAGSYNLNGLTQIDSGQIDFNSAATIGSLLVNGGILGGTGAVTVIGQTTWTGGTITGASSIEAVGGLKLGFATSNTSSTLNLAGGRSFINDAVATGPANGAPLTLNLAGGSSITNKTGATFTFTGNSSIANNGGVPAGGTFINQGTLGTNGGTGTTVFGTPITNSGTIQAQTGTIRLSAGSTFTSTTQLKASAGATLNFPASTFTIPAGASTTGAGNLLVNGATVTYAGSYNLTGLTRIDSGELDFNAAATAGSLMLTGGTLGGSGALLVTGATTWNGGTMTGTGSTEAKGGLTLGFTSGNAQATLSLVGRSLINGAVANVGSNGGVVLNVSNGSAITNKVGATINILSNSTIANNGGAPAGGTFTNQGSFVVNGPTGTTAIGVNVTNTGTLSVQTGTVNLTGTLSNFNAATSTLTGGTYNVRGILAFANAKIVTNKAAITLTSATSDIRDLLGNSALGTFTAANGSSGSLLLQTGRNLTVDSFANAGQFFVYTGSVFTSNGNFTQTSGKTVLNVGTLTSLTNVVSISGGNLEGKGTINGNVTASGGFVRPGAANATGLLTINGNYTQGSTETLGIEIAGPTAGSTYDRLAVTGTASLNGTLAVSFIKNYVPVAGLTFRPLTFGSKTGDFSAKTGLNVGPAVLAPNYDATGLNLVENVSPVIPALAPTLDANGFASFSLTATDAETAAANLVFTITSLPATGTLTSGGLPVAVGQTFTGSPVALVYQTPNFIFGDFTSSFGFTVSDTGTPIGIVATTASTVSLSLAGPAAGVATIFGAPGNDTILAANSGGNLQVTVNGVVNNTGVPVSSITQLNVFGGNGNNTIEVSGLAINTTLTGGAGTNNLIVDGTSGADTFNINSSTSVGINGATITGTSPLTINGVGGNDTFNILAPNIGATLIAGSGNDTFALADGASITTPINGGGGTNTIDESAVTTMVWLNTGSSTLVGLLVPFSNIQNVIGGSNAANSVTGSPSGSTFNITGANTGNVDGIAFSGFGNVVGGAGNDSFVFSNGATISGMLDGAGGTNTIDDSAFTTAVAVNLSASTIPGVGTTFTLVQSLIGSTTAGGTITAPAAGTTYNIIGANAGNVGGVSFSKFANLIGGAGNDIFKFSDGATISGTIDGGTGINTIDELAYTTSVNLNLATITVTGIGTTYANIQTIVAGTGANTVSGPVTGSIYNITVLDSGNIGGLNFIRFGSLVGGPGNDVFKFTTGGSLSGGINGGGGSDTIDDSSLTAPVTLDLSTTTISLVAAPLVNIQNVIGGSSAGNQILASASGSTFNITGANIGNVAGISFTAFRNLTGGAGNDVFKFSNAATLSGSINGGAGTNTADMSAYTTSTGINIQGARMTGVSGFFSSIQSFIGGSNSANKITGPNTASVYNVTATNAGNVNGISFSGFGSFTGGTANDSFVFSAGATITGSLNGGGGADTINLSAYTTPVSVVMATSRVTGLGGTFAAIQSLIGGSNASNTVTGPAAATTFNITALNTFNANGLSFSSFRKITAGAGQDTFVISNGAGLSGMIDGGLGNNWLDYSAYTTGVTVNLTTKAATGFGAGVSNIVNVRGGSGNDTLTGNSKGNILIGGAGNDTLTGGTGVSLLIGGTGADTINGGSGGDLIIGGTTSYDNNNTALDSILAEWQLADTYANRISALKNGGGVNGTNVLNLGTTVIDDLAVNVLTGAAGGKNWYFKGTSDTITNLQAGEQVN